ncbi:MAG: hypothetical protein ACI3T9_02305 [Romboutsia timonensis]
MLFSLSSGAALVLKLSGLAMTTCVLNSLLDASDKKEWIVRVNIVAGIVAIIVIYSGPVKEALQVAESFMQFIE